MKSIEARALGWACGGDTGLSSEAIFAVMTGNKPRYGYSYPWDGDDLGRCLRLLTLIPEWRARLHEMGEKSAQWAALVEHWDELKALHEKAAWRPLFDRMHELLRAAGEKGGGKAIKIGTDISVWIEP